MTLLRRRGYAGARGEAARELLSTPAMMTAYDQGLLNRRFNGLEIEEKARARQLMRQGLVQLTCVDGRSAVVAKEESNG